MAEDTTYIVTTEVIGGPDLATSSKDPNHAVKLGRAPNPDRRMDGPGACRLHISQYVGSLG